MTLQSTGRSKERVLLFGLEGTGKSDALLDIAGRVHPNRVHIIDNDNAWDRMLEGQSVSGAEGQVAAEYRWTSDGAFELDDRFVTEGGNIIVWHVDGWEANAQAIAEVRADAGPDDWCGIDSGSALWSDVSDWYIDTIWGKSKADYFLQTRLAIERGDTGEGLDGWKDWSVINAQYREKVMGFLVNPPCHLLVTAEQDDVSSVQIKGKQVEDAETRALYGGVHVKPRGQKRMGHNMQTVLQLTRDASGKYKVRTVKDRGGRARLAAEDVTGYGFGEWYLEEVGGWTEHDTTDSTSSTSVAPTAPTPAPKGSNTTPTSSPAKPVAKGLVAKG